MSNQNYIIDLLELKDSNIYFKENFYYKEKIKGIIHKIFEGYLSYKPDYCPKCGVVFDSKFEKHGFIVSNIKIPDVLGFHSILKLHKQRYLCKHCNKAFTLTSNITNYGCFISNITKHKIAKDLTKKCSEKDIAINNNVSPNTVERVMDSFYETQKLYKHYLPEVLSFDEFKSVKSADGAMSFHMCNGITGQTIDIIEDRRLDNLIRYFFFYDYKVRSKVKFIIIDKFHLTQLISRSHNKTRIRIMNKDKKNHRKLKRYWRLILKDRDELDYSKWKKYVCFNSLMTQSDVVDYLINIDEELKQTYLIYQNILYSFKKKDFNKLKSVLNNINSKISNYMKTSIKTILEFLPYIKNTFENEYHNGFIEGNNNFIKVIKRIAFGFRTFRRFKARIMICKGLLKIKKNSQCITH